MTMSSCVCRAVLTAERPLVRPHWIRDDHALVQPGTAATFEYLDSRCMMARCTGCGRAIQTVPEGFWEISILGRRAVFDSLTDNNRLIVEGTGGDDTIIVRTSSRNPAYLEVLINGSVKFTGPHASIDIYDISGLSGDDTITVLADQVVNRIYISGGGDDDIVSIGNPSGVSWVRALEIDLGTGNDKVQLAQTFSG